jgi:hypothetical protein
VLSRPFKHNFVDFPKTTLVLTTCGYLSHPAKRPALEAPPCAKWAQSSASEGQKTQLVAVEHLMKSVTFVIFDVSENLGLQIQV